METKDMHSRVILVTGTSSGIGKSTALKLIRDGNIVYCAALDIERIADLENAGGHPVYLDVADRESVLSCVQQILDRHGRINVLVNSAGCSLYGSVEDVTIEEARNQFDVNLFGMAQVTKAVLPVMRKQRSGRIINVSSMGGKIYSPLGAWYHATMHAVEGWSDCLRIEVKQFGVKVIIVQPGLIKTDVDDLYVGPMLARSDRSPYRDMAESVAKSTRHALSNGQSSSPEVISDVISEAITSQTPKTRYVAGKMARPLMLMRKWLGDRIYDNAVLNQV